MKRTCLVVICVAFAANASAQRVIHDDGRDKSAQDAAAAAKDVTSGSLFAKMLANVDAQAHREADTTMKFVEQQMRAKLENFDRWTDPSDAAAVARPLPGGAGVMPGSCRSIRCELESLRVKQNFSLGANPTPAPADINAQLKFIAAKKKQLEDELKALKTDQTDPAIVRVFALLDDPGRDIVEYAGKAAAAADGHGISTQAISKALDTIGGGLDQVIAIYKSVEGAWAAQKAISVDPASLRPPPHALDIRMLALAQDHLKTVARIEARRDMDTGSALMHVDTALEWMESAGLTRSTERVEDTLRRQSGTHDPSQPPRQDLTRSLDILHEAAAAIAEEDAAGRLAELRLSDEMRRQSILRSAVNASAYDQTIQAAVQRLAMYWKSGIKPADIAQLAFYLVNTIAIPAIAIK